jgi:hypothetical protein
MKEKDLLKDIKLSVLIIVGYLGLMFLGVWVFNHVHAWLGVGILVITTLVAGWIAVKRFINYHIHKFD